MKKFFLFSLIFCMCQAGFSQHETRLANNLNAKKICSYNAVDHALGDVSQFQNPSTAMIKSTVNLGPSETHIGTTLYDLFSNYNIGNRFHRFADGTITGVFMISLESGFPDRGTGYNYYNGASWGPEPGIRIESIKTGWPAYTPWGAEGEMFVSHDFAAQELYILKRQTKGEGLWSESMFPHPGGPDDLVWPKMITSGENNEVIHLIGCTNAEWMGQNPTYVYSRSVDGGLTWDPHDIVIDGMGEDYYLNVVQDRCFMAANGNSVAILYVDVWTDLYYVRSDDNGDTWETTVVWEHPIPFFDPATMYVDTFYCPDWSGSMTIDDNGHAHVVFGLQRGISDESGSGVYAWNPNNDGIVYWNDMMEPFSNDINALAPPHLNVPESELVVDENYIGWMQDVDGNGVVELEGIFAIRTYGMSTQPSISVDDYGQRFVIWAANTEGFVYSGGDEPVNYKHIWSRAYANGVWGDFMDLTEDIAHIFDDCVYPMIASTSDDHIHYMYQADIAPGNSIDGDHDEHDNYWIYGMLPKSDLLTGIQEQQVTGNAVVSQNFPNPFSGISSVNVTIESNTNLSLVVTNMTGQRVLWINKGHVEKGNHSFNIDGTQLGPGIYFYTVISGKSEHTHKMIIK
ncbi:MAG: T9SS type A sorting domain-containing protein [Bacteroidales bacterium]|nr:T9SS type A sorting domain-containing protein [Bacteroidales bacterium]